MLHANETAVKIQTMLVLNVHNLFMHTISGTFYMSSVRMCPGTKLLHVLCILKLSLLLLGQYLKQCLGLPVVESFMNSIGVAFTCIPTHSPILLFP